MSHGTAWIGAIGGDVIRIFSILERLRALVQVTARSRLVSTPKWACDCSTEHMLPPDRPKIGSYGLEPGEITRTLRRHAFLAGFAAAHLEILTKIAHPVEFRDQDLILEAHQEPNDFYLLLEGSVTIELNKEHFAVQIQLLGPGDAFGWSALLKHHDTLFNVRAREGCKVLRLDGAGLSAALREDSVLAAEFLTRTLRLVASRMDATEVRLAEFCGVRIATAETDSVAAAIRALSRLIEVCLDGELGYRTAAEHLRDSKLRIVLTDYAIRRAEFAAELGAEVERLGGRPSHSGSMTASLHRGWIALKAAVLGGDPKAIIAACETGEDAACFTYGAAADSNILLSETRSMVEAQRQAIDQTREWLRDIHQELASGAPLPELDVDS